ncbi:uncharacterized protein [Rutidosis leptorrhynchoides]|uniref:uncharacterized protein n=1 Tax=Rutidosis leptorrhynchoides TaxID=125765 RepID=UPI003A994748
MLGSPSSVIKNLKSIRRKFFWGGSGESTKLTWVKWEDSLLPYSEGGLNRSLRGKNLALLGKWIWLVKTKSNSFLASIIKSIHGANGFLIPPGSSGPQGRGGVWANIIRAGLAIDKTCVNFGAFFTRQIGDRRGTNFWTDAWLLDNPLMCQFRRLSQLDADQSPTVRDRVQ